MELYITLVGIFLTVIFWFFKPHHFLKQIKPIPFEEVLKNKSIKDSYRIAVVDDEPEDYPIEYLRGMGYVVNIYKEISIFKSKDLLKYDLLILDVKGVVIEDADLGGAKIIREIKKDRKLLPVIAVSSGRFDAELNEYFNASDDVLKKPVNEFKLKETIERLKSVYFNVDEIAGRISEKIEALNVSGRSKKQLRRIVIKAVNNDLSYSECEAILYTKANVSAKDIAMDMEILIDRLKYAEQNT